MAFKTSDIRDTIYYFNIRQDELTRYKLSAPNKIVQFAEEKGKFLKSFDSYILMDLLDKKYGFGSTTVNDYIEYNFGFNEIAEIIKSKFEDFLKEAEKLKKDVFEMKEFLSQLTYSGKSFSSFVADIGHITKRTANKELDLFKEMYLPNKDYILDGCKNIMGFDNYEMEMVENAFAMLELDNQTIKENA